MNELRAALANFNMRAIAEGVVVVTDKSIVFTPSQLGFYIEDSYDFNDGVALFSQILGYWNFDKLVTDPVEGAKANAKLAAQMNAVMAESQYQGVRGQQSTQQKKMRPYVDIESSKANTTCSFKNSDFRDYRDLNKKGGDFRVYSDIMYEPVTSALIEISAK